MAVLSRRSPAREQARDARRSAVRARIVEATEALVRDGATYADLSVETIACRAGISRTTFYDYFTDKRELLLVMARDAQRDAELQIAEWRPKAGHDASRAELRAFITAYVNAYRHPAVRAVAEAAAYDDEVHAAWRQNQEIHIARVVRVLEAERDAGRFQTHQSTLESRARALHWCVHGTILQELAAGGQPGGDDNLLDALVDVALLGARGVLP
jgi:AcrR family transcriptional regulator